MEQDEKYIEMALNLAEKARGRTSPNPMVGAVVVRGEKIIGSGYHKKAGEPHAEVIALREAGSGAEGATLYVNLEPCCHVNKRTPPCTDEVIRSGIKRVVISMEDPNPLVSGKGMDMLRAAGIKVDQGILKERAKNLNEAFIKYITTKRPFVILKVAASLDGKIALANGTSRWITGEESRKYSHQLRNYSDAIMVGVGTVIKDDPELTCRIEQGRDPVRIIVDSNFSIPLTSKVLKINGTIIATTDKLSKKKEALEGIGAKIIVTNKDKEGRVDLKDLMDKLGEMGIMTLLIEGGSKINASVLNEGIVDKIIFMFAPVIIGGDDAIGAIGGISPSRMSDLIRLRDIEVRKSDMDIIVEGYVESATEEPRIG